MFKTIITIAAIFLSLSTIVNADTLEGWDLIQNEEIKQWDATYPGVVETRISFASFIDWSRGKRVSFYAIHRQCADGLVTTSFVGYNNKIGFGNNCSANLVLEYELDTILSKIQTLPFKARLIVHLQPNDPIENYLN